jgi:hypothetical protein
MEASDPSTLHKSFVFAQEGVAQHLQIVTTELKMIDINIAMTERNYQPILEKIRRIKVHLDIAADHIGVLHEIESKKRAERQATQKRREFKET